MAEKLSHLAPPVHETNERMIAVQSTANKARSYQSDAQHTVDEYGKHQDHDDDSAHAIIIVLTFSKLVHV
jgi:hypothetical protein